MCSAIIGLMHVAVCLISLWSYYEWIRVSEYRTGVNWTAFWRCCRQYGFNSTNTIKCNNWRWCHDRAVLYYFYILLYPGYNNIANQGVIQYNHDTVISLKSTHPFKISTFYSSLNQFHKSAPPFCARLRYSAGQIPWTIWSVKYQWSGLRFLLWPTEISIQITDILWNVHGTRLWCSVSRILAAPKRCQL